MMMFMQFNLSSIVHMNVLFLKQGTRGHGVQLRCSIGTEHQRNQIITRKKIEKNEGKLCEKVFKIINRNVYIAEF